MRENALLFNQRRATRRFAIICLGLRLHRIGDAAEAPQVWQQDHSGALMNDLMFDVLTRSSIYIENNRQELGLYALSLRLHNKHHSHHLSRALKASQEPVMSSEEQKQPSMVGAHAKVGAPSVCFDEPG